MEFVPRDFFEYANIQLEEKKLQREQELEYLGELLASIHNNGHPYEGKKGISRKDIIRLSYDEAEEEINMDDMQELMAKAEEMFKHLEEKKTQTNELGWQLTAN